MTLASTMREELASLPWVTKPYGLGKVAGCDLLYIYKNGKFGCGIRLEGVGLIYHTDATFDTIKDAVDDVEKVYCNLIDATSICALAKRLDRSLPETYPSTLRTEGPLCVAL